jgi:hypothetical protein
MVINYSIYHIATSQQENRRLRLMRLQAKYGHLNCRFIFFESLYGLAQGHAVQPIRCELGSCSLRPCKCARANYHELPLPLHPRTPPIHHHSPTHKHISICTATHPALVTALAITPKSSFSSAIRPCRPTLHHPPTDDDRSTLPSPADPTCYQRHRHFSRAYYLLTPHE